MSYTDQADVSFTNRDALAGVMPLLSQRWSPRAFQPHKISDADVDVLFDAARWAPSCFNEQPWRFYVSSENTFQDFLKLLAPANQDWAKDASLLVFAACKTTFTRNDKSNAYAEFDTGAAWMSLALQARSMGLYTHGMGGIDHDGAAKYLNLPDDQKVICGLAIGVVADTTTLSDEQKAKEVPNARHPLADTLTIVR